MEIYVKMSFIFMFCFHFFLVSITILSYKPTLILPHSISKDSNWWRHKSGHTYSI